MKNSFINRFKSKKKINIKGKNIERFIKRLIKNNIEIISLEKIKYDEINIIIYKKDLEIIEEIKTIYEVEIIRSYGLDKIKNIIFKNKYILLFIVIGMIIIYFLSNMIFSIEVVHSSKEIRTLIKKELKEYGIDKYKLKKNYHELEDIKEQILNKYNNKIEWMEIEEYGTKYRIRVEERIVNNNKNTLYNRDLIAKKNGIIISVEASNGEIIKNKNDYVSKGDVIVSGNLSLNEEIKKQVPAKGKVYAEVWYTVKVKHPYHYKKITKTNKSKTIYSIKFINKYYNFELNRYKNKIIKNKTLIKNNYIPIGIIKQKQYEIIKIDKTYNKKDVIKAAINKAKNKLLKKLNNDSVILDYYILDKIYNKKNIELNIFFTVKENITDYRKINPIIDTKLDE